MEKPNNIERPLTQAEIEKKLEKFALRLKAWKERHPFHAPPLSFNSKTQEFEWVNREHRRKLKRKRIEKRQFPELARALEDKKEIE